MDYGCVGALRVLNDLKVCKISKISLVLSRFKIKPTPNLISTTTFVLFQSVLEALLLGIDTESHILTQTYFKKYQSICGGSLCIYWRAHCRDVTGNEGREK